MTNEQNLPVPFQDRSALTPAGGSLVNRGLQQAESLDPVLHWDSWLDHGLMAISFGMVTVPVSVYKAVAPDHRQSCPFLDSSLTSAEELEDRFDYEPFRVFSIETFIPPNESQISKALTSLGIH